MITVKDIKAKFIQSLNLKNYHHTKYRDEELGIQIEVITNKDGDYAVHEGKSYYFIDGDKHEFKTVEELVIAYNELFPNGRPNEARKRMKAI